MEILRLNLRNLGILVGESERYVQVNNINLLRKGHINLSYPFVESGLKNI
jgi:hypothetical protein